MEKFLTVLIFLSLTACMGGGGGSSSGSSGGYSASGYTGGIGGMAGSEEQLAGPQQEPGLAPVPPTLPPDMTNSGGDGEFLAAGVFYIGRVITQLPYAEVRYTISSSCITAVEEALAKDLYMRILDGVDDQDLYDSFLHVIRDSYKDCVAAQREPSVATEDSATLLPVLVPVEGEEASTGTTEDDPVDTRYDSDVTFSYFICAYSDGAPVDLISPPPEDRIGDEISCTIQAIS